MVTRGEKSAPNQDPRNALGKARWSSWRNTRCPTLVSRIGDCGCTRLDPVHAGPDVRHEVEFTQPLNLILALLEAIDAGADEALMLDPRGASRAATPRISFACARASADLER